MSRVYAVRRKSPNPTMKICNNMFSGGNFAFGRFEGTGEKGNIHNVNKL
jgi:hypothetical protein